MSPVNISFSAAPSPSATFNSAPPKAGQTDAGRKGDFFALLNERQASDSPRQSDAPSKGDAGSVTRYDRKDQLRGNSVGANLRQNSSSTRSNSNETSREPSKPASSPVQGQQSSAASHQTTNPKNDTGGAERQNLAVCTMNQDATEITSTDQQSMAGNNNSTDQKQTVGDKDAWSIISEPAEKPESMDASLAALIAGIFMPLQTQVPQILVPLIGDSTGEGNSPPSSSDGTIVSVLSGIGNLTGTQQPVGAMGSPGLLQGSKVVTQPGADAVLLDTMLGNLTKSGTDEVTVLSEVQTGVASSTKIQNQDNVNTIDTSSTTVLQDTVTISDTKVMSAFEEQLKALETSNKPPVSEFNPTYDLPKAVVKSVDANNSTKLPANATVRPSITAGQAVTATETTTIDTTDVVPAKSTLADTSFSALKGPQSLQIGISSDQTPITHSGGAAGLLLNDHEVPQSERMTHGASMELDAASRPTIPEVAQPGAFQVQSRSENEAASESMQKTNVIVQVQRMSENEAASESMQKTNVIVQVPRSGTVEGSELRDAGTSDSALKSGPVQMKTTSITDEPQAVQSAFAVRSEPIMNSVVTTQIGADIKDDEPHEDNTFKAHKTETALSMGSSLSAPRDTVGAIQAESHSRGTEAAATLSVNNIINNPVGRGMLNNNSSEKQSNLKIQPKLSALSADQKTEVAASEFLSAVSLEKSPSEVDKDNILQNNLPPGKSSSILASERNSDFGRLFSISSDNVPAAASLRDISSVAPTKAQELTRTILNAIPKPITAMNIEIKPEGFGTIHVRIFSQASGDSPNWRIDIRTSDPAARALLSDSLHELRQSLKTDRVSVQESGATVAAPSSDLRGEAKDGSQERGRNQQAFYESNGRRGGRGKQEAFELLTEE